MATTLSPRELAARENAAANFDQKERGRPRSLEIRQEAIFTALDEHGSLSRAALARISGQALKSIDEAVAPLIEEGEIQKRRMGKYIYFARAGEWK